MKLALLEQYKQMYTAYNLAGFSRSLNPHDTEFAGNKESCFAIGRDGLDICVQSLIVSERPVPTTILDLPCGSGRVLRHLIAYFPQARIHASDLYEHHLTFCAQTFGVTTFPSHADLEKLVPPCTYDLIFIGSLLSHLPRAGVEALWPDPLKEDG